MNTPVASAWIREKTVLVTGATDGIGREAALAFARAGATVIVHGRDAGRCEETRRAIDAEPGAGPAACALADLASRGGVRALADEVAGRTDRLHVVVHNAGVYMNRRRLTPDGLEMTFAVNHIAPFLLTALLMPLLVRGAPARVVTVSSATHASAELDFDNLQAERSFDPYQAYALSKLGNVLFAVELAARVPALTVSSNRLHPGTVATKLLHAGFPSSRGVSPADGARTTVVVASGPELLGVTGRYFVDGRPRDPSPLAADTELRRRFWAVSAELAGAEPLDGQ